MKYISRVCARTRRRAKSQFPQLHLSNFASFHAHFFFRSQVTRSLSVIHQTSHAKIYYGTFLEYIITSDTGCFACNRNYGRETCAHRCATRRPVTPTVLCRQVGRAVARRYVAAECSLNCVICSLSPLSSE